MSPRILASCSPGEMRVAVVDDALPEHALLDYALHRPGAPDGVGDLFLGRIEAVLPAMGGAFVLAGQDSAFLPDRDGAAGRSEGGSSAAPRAARARARRRISTRGSKPWSRRTAPQPA